MTSRLRLRDYDYATPGAYFVTICTAKRGCLFGEVHNDEVALSIAGLMVESWWHSIPRRFPDVNLDAMIVMPNHIHGVVTIGFEPGDADRVDTGNPSLSDIIYWFKSITTNDYMLGVRSYGWPRFPGTLWQERFYDHVVQGESALDRVRRYINANPAQWPQDEYNPGK